MPKSDWYSRVMLTAIAGLLLVVAAELRLSNQLSLAAGQASQPAAQYAPYPVAFRPASLPATVQEVRIVGYRYGQSGSSRIRDFGTGYDQAAGLPVVSAK